MLCRRISPTIHVFVSCRRLFSDLNLHWKTTTKTKLKFEKMKNNEKNWFKNSAEQAIKLKTSKMTNKGMSNMTLCCYCFFTSINTRWQRYCGNRSFLCGSQAIRTCFFSFRVLKLTQGSIIFFCVTWIIVIFDIFGVFHSCFRVFFRWITTENKFFLVCLAINIFIKAQRWLHQTNFHIKKKTTVTLFEKMLPKRGGDYVKIISFKQ